MGDAEALRAAACCGEKGLLSCIDLASLLQGTSAAVGADDACASPAKGRGTLPLPPPNPPQSFS